jgi:hypothetical protein
MKSGYSILTRKIWGIDVHVWLTMLTIIVISAGILIFKITKNVECKLFDTLVSDDSGSNTNSLYVNENVVFTANVSGNVEWDFGDGAKVKGTHVKHVFLNGGKQTITVSSNGRCQQLITLIIFKNAPNPSDQPEANPIWAPEKAVVGKKVTFAYLGDKKPTAFEWSIVNLPITPVRYGNHEYRVSYVFPAEGRQTIELRLNNDPARTFTRDITIIPASEKNSNDHPYVAPPPPSTRTPDLATSAPKTGTNSEPVSSAPKTPVHENAPVETKKTERYLSDDVFKQMFEDVAAGKKNAQSFDPYLCNGVVTRVNANDADETLESVCIILASGHKKIQSVHAVRSNDCVVLLKIKYRNKLLNTF